MKTPDTPHTEEIPIAELDGNWQWENQSLNGRKVWKKTLSDFSVFLQLEADCAQLNSWKAEWMGNKGSTAGCSAVGAMR